jgi:hypothetical protein
MEYINDELWFSGLDSISNPGRLPAGTYQWAQNVVNRGGMIQTRQGVAEVANKLLDIKSGEKPRGICLFYPFQQGVNPFLVTAIGKYIYALPFPYSEDINESHRLPNIIFPTAYPRQVHFEICVQAQTTSTDASAKDLTALAGMVKLLPSPRFILMIQDGYSQPAYFYFDGRTRKTGHVVPDTKHPKTPIGDYMKWAGDRLWVAKDNKLHASDLLNPLQFEEEKIEASGGFFYLPSHVTGMGVSHDYKSLLVFTDQTTSAFQVGIEDRPTWPSTQDFQRVVFPSIGCAAHRTIVNQYGNTWWMSHDGLMAMDSALITYQSSRMQVRDRQMSRSKEGVSWSAGGGCAGTFGNFLFFSMPSGSIYNQHTWVMDEAPVEQIATPAVWCANWTGLRPEQWVTGDVNGVMRCFCISHDVVPYGQGKQATIWEAFIGQRMDIPRDETPARNRKPKDIGCAWESKFLMLGPNQFAKFRYVELDLAEIIGNVHVQVYYCGRKTSYKRILDKRLQATVTPETEVIFDPDALVNIFVPQYRTVRSVTDSHDTDDHDTEIQTPYIRSIDKEFSILVTWTGQMAITGMRVCVDPLPDYMEGLDEEDELTARRITAEGTGFIFDTDAPDNNFIQAFTSKYLSPLRPRWVEFPAYDSAVANGVFFVEALVVNPPEGAYLKNTFPKAVTITTPTVGSQIRYSVNGPMPTHDTGTVYDGAHHPSVPLNGTLRARGFRTHMSPSIPFEGKYTQSQVAAPVFSIPEGGYIASQYPISVVVSTATPNMRMRWTENGANPSPTSGNQIIGSSGTISVPANKTLKVIAYDFANNYLPSTITSGHYSVKPQVGKPTLTPAGGLYPNSNYDPTKDITIKTNTAGATLRYTINNEDVENGTFVNAQTKIVPVKANDVLRVIAQKSPFADSEIVSGTYGLIPAKVATPTLDPPPRSTYPLGDITVTFHCATAGASIAYTEQNIAEAPDIPTHTHYDAIVHDGDTHRMHLGHQIIRMIAFRGDMSDSDPVTAEYDHFHASDRGGGGGHLPQ